MLSVSSLLTAIVLTSVGVTLETRALKQTPLSQQATIVLGPDIGEFENVCPRQYSAGQPAVARTPQVKQSPIQTPLTKSPLLDKLPTEIGALIWQELSPANTSGKASWLTLLSSNSDYRDDIYSYFYRPQHLELYFGGWAFHLFLSGSLGSWAINEPQPGQRHPLSGLPVRTLKSIRVYILPPDDQDPGELASTFQ